MQLQDIFGANVRQHRKAKGWTIEQLADRVGVTQETIGKIERGKAAPLFETAGDNRDGLGSRCYRAIRRGSITRQR